MTESILITSATLNAPGGTFPLNISDPTVTLDEGWAPYAQAQLVIAIPSAAALDALDPRTPGVRVTITARRTVPALGLDQTRAFDLGLRSRSIDHATATVSIELASDEALLQDWARYADTTSLEALPYQSSLRGLVNAVVLAKIGATLQPGTADADFTTLTALTNYIKNPSAEVDAANWFGNGATITRSTAKAWIGSASIAATAGGATPAWSPHASNADRVPVTPGATYTFSTNLLSSAARTAFVALRYYDAQGVQIGADNQSAQTATSTTAWKRYSVTAVAPANAATAFVYCRTVGDTSGTIHYTDGSMLAQSNGFDTDTVTTLAYFDGNTPDTAFYNYDWTGTAGASTSTRTPVFQRDPQALWIEPGEDLWKFISGVLDQAGLRLFCDENRKWRLVDSTYTVAGRVTVAQGFNAYGAEDTIARDATNDAGEPSWFDAVILKYIWNDTTNTERTAFDLAKVAGTPTRVLMRELRRPFPGPGAAAYILKRANGRGRQLTLPAALDLSTTPGMVASATVPYTPVQTGYLSSVKFDLGQDAMTVGTRGLTDTQPSAWVYLPTGQRWIDSPVGASWIAETV
ncbi:carbohydrate binding domain-containing protein [Leifsonia aquatica]|uniref:carbohydrate binding domain-containing protein n=1 Tax=Leifsonia aquatica TaxID=144185 RepID=UPI0028AD57C5|nr:carbohydrate binding domain-containing protein [Leifsonia aquatica]